MIVRFFRFLGTVLFSCCDHDNDRDHLRFYYYNELYDDNLQTNGRANSKRQNHYHYNDDSIRANHFAPSPTSVNSFVKSSNASNWSSQSKLQSNAHGSFHPTNIGSEASNSSLLSNQIKSPLEQSNGKLNICTSSFPSKSVSSSSPQRPGAVSFAQSNIKSNTSTSSLSTKTVRPDASNSSFLFNQIKSPSEQSNIKSKAVPSSSPQRPGAVSIAQSNTSTSSFSRKTVQSSSPLRPDATSLSNNFVTKPAIGSCMQYVVKSNLPKNSRASKPLPAEFIASSSSNTGSVPSKIEDPKEVGKRGTQRYEIPKNIEEMIKNDIIPPVLKKPLSPDTYADYFAALLYAEDFYYEKYSDYLLKDVALELREKPNPGLQDQSHKKKSKRGSNSKTQKNYPFVAFEIKKVDEIRPFLLSRDHVHLKPVGKGIDFEPFHGILFRFERGTILAEFKDDFHNQHKPLKRYDVSFSFNRVCLKRAHRAVSAAASPLLTKILFPNITSLPTLRGRVSPMDQILNHKLAPIPYLIEYEGPPSFTVTSPVTSLIKNVVLKIYESCKESRILICAPKNRTCDDLVRLIMENVCEFDIFRANAAFREKELVPDDIMPACIYRRECFTCPPLDELQRFRIITSTFVSTFRLYNAGLKAGHFSHIFLLDASSAIEPVAIVALVDLVSEETVIVVTGSVQDQPRWVRSDIGRKHGLKESFFERLRRSEPYWSDNPLLKTNI
ncbi:putative RNA helicase SDE3 isoform X1 [Carex rostrata]